MRADDKVNEGLSETDKAFTMLMYPGRTEYMSLDSALEIAGIEDNAEEDIYPAKNIKEFFDGKDYAKVREEFIKHNKEVLKALKGKPYSDHS